MRGCVYSLELLLVCFCVGVCCGRYLATAVSLAPQFLLSANMQQY
jgi:hypothetical protein